MSKSLNESINIYIKYCPEEMSLLKVLTYMIILHDNINFQIHLI